MRDHIPRWSVCKRNGRWRVCDRGVWWSTHDSLYEAGTEAMQNAVADMLYAPGGLTWLMRMVDTVEGR